MPRPGDDPRSHATLCLGDAGHGGDDHFLDAVDRTPLLKESLGIGYCNITKCCTEVCPEDIHITDNAIIPLKERVVDRYYDPLLRLWRKIRGR